jgi:hypothetical protein
VRHDGRVQDRAARALERFDRAASRRFGENGLCDHLVEGRR